MKFREPFTPGVFLRFKPASETGSGDNFSITGLEIFKRFFQTLDAVETMLPLLP